MDRRDIYEKRPSGMNEYLAAYGWHFSKNMAQSAVSRCFGDMPLMSAEDLRKKSAGMEGIRLAKGYDAQYLLCKYRHDFPDFSESQVLYMVNMFLLNNYQDATFTHYYADCIACGVPIIWEDAI